MNVLKAYLGTLLSFLIIDAVWITLVVRGLYEREVGAMLSDTPRMLPAAVFYLGYAAAIVILAVRPALESAKLKLAMTNGALIGAVGYGTYTVTNYSVFDSWTATLVWTDIAWGAFLTAVCAACGYLAAGRRRAQSLP